MYLFVRPKRCIDITSNKFLIILLLSDVLILHISWRVKIMIDFFLVRLFVLVLEKWTVVPDPCVLQQAVLSVRPHTINIHVQLCVHEIPWNFPSKDKYKHKYLSRINICLAGVRLRRKVVGSAERLLKQWACIQDVSGTEARPAAVHGNTGLSLVIVSWSTLCFVALMK